MQAVRPTWAEISLDAVEHNVREVKGLTKAAVMAVVKANGYGHGAVPVARAALAAGATWLGVAIPEEGASLREAGVEAKILVLGYTPPEEAELYARHGLTATVGYPEQLVALGQAAAKAGRKVAVHLKVDTGMGRLGLVGPEAVVALAAQVTAHPWLILEGLFTHLAAADEADLSHARGQLAEFERVLAALTEAGLRPPVIHAANSAALLTLPESHYDLVRAGIFLYGYWPSQEVFRRFADKLSLKQVLTWKSHFSHVKAVPAGATISYGATYQAGGPEVVATLPVGYADGYSRAWSNRGRVLYQGQPLPIVGVVCMDQLMVVAPPTAQVGEEVTLLGPGFDAAQWAEQLGTIPYEVLCLISERVARLYLPQGLGHPNSQ